MVGESNQNVFLIQIDESSFAEFEISEFEISRVDCSLKPGETPRYPASHQASNDVQRSKIHVLQKKLTTARCGCGAIVVMFSIYLKPVL